MREIEFRGQNINGHWAHGNLAIIKEKLDRAEIGTYISNSAGAPFAYQVRPETVGQYTERQDIHNNKIFEKDIATCQFFDKKITGLIEFIEYMWAVNDRKNQRLYQLNEVSNIEVVGNVEENPELLEEQ
ncbi:TPA: YopX family protein [Listeria innocua]